MENLREKSIRLIEKYIRNENLKKHLLATEAFMRALARRLNQDEEIWGIAGLIHDIDWDLTRETPEKHSLLGAEILTQEGYPPEIVSAVKIHNYIHGLEPQTLLEKALYLEALTGFIVAVALVMPNKKLSEVTVERILSKLKEPSFAKGVKREIIYRGEEFLGLKFEEIIEICLKAMQEISDQLGL
jgi:uncharacterized protein